MPTYSDEAAGEVLDKAIEIIRNRETDGTPTDLIDFFERTDDFSFVIRDEGVRDHHLSH